MRITIKVDTKDIVNDIKRKLQKTTRNNKKGLLKSIGIDMVSEVKTRFKKGVDMNGKKWVPLKPDTIAARRKRNPGKWVRPLIDTGALRASVSKYTLKYNYVEIKSNAPYADIHQYGYRPKNIPARPFLGINKSQKKRYNKLITLYYK